MAAERDDRRNLRDELAEALNRHSAENGSDTPDFILAAYLLGCLRAWDEAVRARESWYGIRSAWSRAESEGG